jgi:uncharacterized protein (TIGR03643 family)
MNPEENTYCYYSDLPSPLAYMQEEEKLKPVVLSPFDIDRIIEMAWEDRTPFEAIEMQFGLKESAVKTLMKKHLKFSSYALWRKRVEACKTKHRKTRTEGINRFKCNLQRSISSNKISKRNRS